MTPADLTALEAPERIWAYHNGNSQTYLTAPNKFHNVEYVRADAIADLQRKLDEAREVIRPLAGDTLPNMRRTEIGFDKNGLRRCISPMELACLAARRWLENK